jgi:hypothetical protein
MDFRPGPNMVIGDLGATPLHRVPTDLMNHCMKKGKLKPPQKTKIEIYVGTEGKAAGVQLDGIGESDPAVRRCLIRYAATVSFPPLKNGDYALVGYTAKLESDI